MYRPGGAPELVAGTVLLAIAAALGLFALILGQAGGGEGGAGIAALFLGAGSVFFGGFGGFMLLGIDSKQLSLRVGTVGLALALIPYFLFLGRPGYALNAIFLVAALSSGLGIWLRRQASSK
jgi:hypothetical protein